MYERSKSYRSHSGKHVLDHGDLIDLFNLDHADPIDPTRSICAKDVDPI